MAELLETLESMATADKEMGKDKMKLCCKCGEPALLSTGFMLRLDVWLEANGQKLGHMHLACVEQVLGRQLTIDDFTTVVLNYPFFFGYAMGRRDDGLSEV